MLINSQTDRSLQKVLHNIESGKFAQDFLEESKQGHPALKRLRTEEKHSLLVRTGKRLREILKF
jgi:ketol-acid reductoisomerase